MPSADDPARIPAVSRYMGAWGEINARLSVRIQINTYHAASIIAVTAAYYAIQDNSTNSNIIAVDPHVIPAIFMPIISTIFVLWYIHNDVIIGLLSAFCAEIERQDSNLGGSISPYWFFGESPKTINGCFYGRIQILALRQRRLSDYATIIICFISPILIVINLFNRGSVANWIFFGVSCVWLTVISYFIWITKRKREELLDTKYDNVLGLWEVSIVDISLIAFFKAIFKKSVSNYFRIKKWVNNKIK